MCFESFKDHVIIYGKWERKDYKTNTSLLFPKNSIDINICAFMNKPESMNHEKKEDLREHKCFFILNFQYIIVRKHQILNSEKALQSLLWIRTANALIIMKCDFSPVVEIANIGIRKIYEMIRAKKFGDFFPVCLMRYIPFAGIVNISTYVLF